MDLHVEFRLSSRYQAKELYKRFYLPRASDAEDASTVKDGEDEMSSDSGYVTPTKEGPGSAPTAPGSVESNAPVNFSGMTHSTHTPKLSKERVDHLAERFASQIPDREFSMASLQGYLMSYKTRPFQAVDNVEQWIKHTRVGRDRKAEASAVHSQT